MKIASPAFVENQIIPAEYTCEGQNTNPPLTFSSIPENTQTLVLLMEDVDATPIPWIHWLVFNIPPTTLFVDAGQIPLGGIEGLANGGTFGYEGPCPRFFSGIHHYVFTLYAVNKILTIIPSSSKEKVLEEIKNNIVDYTSLTALAIGH